MAKSTDLQVWKNLIEVQKAGSVYAASQILDIDASLLGRQIQGLEKELGVALLDRTVRPAQFTEAGLIAAEKAQTLIDQFNEMISTVKENPDKMEGRIVLAGSKQIASSIVTPRIIQFQALYPKIELDLRTLSKGALETIQNPKSDVMVSIGFGSKAEGKVFSQYLGAVPLISCASPSYIEKFGLPKHPSELSKHTLISYPNLLTQPLRYLHKDGESVKIEAKKTIKISDPISAKRAILLGAGCAVATGISLFLEELKDGKLVRFFEGWQPSSMETYIYATESAWKLKRIREFVQWWADPSVKREYFVYPQEKK